MTAPKTFAAGEVFGQFRQWANDPKTMVIAAHTSDLKGVIVEFGACDMAGRLIYSRRCALSGGHIAPGAYRVHGIAEHALTDAPPFREVWTQIRRLMAARRAVAYASDFVASALSLSLAYALNPSQHSPPEVSQQFAEVERFRVSRAADVINAYAYVSGKRRTGGEQPFQFRPLKAALAELGIRDEDLGTCALDQARRTARLIRAVSELNEFEERFVHLHEGFPGVPGDLTEAPF